MKLLIWGLIAVAIVFWVLRHKKPSRKSKNEQRGENVRGDSEAMLQCAHCGVHIPASEANYSSTGIAYCSDAHRLLHHGPSS